MIGVWATRVAAPVLSGALVCLTDLTASAALAAPAAIAAVAAPTAGATATVQSQSGNLNIRTGPSTAYESVSRLASGSRITVTCQATGQTVSGAVRTTAIWNRLSNGNFVSDAYVRWSPARPTLASCPKPHGVVRTDGSGGLNVRSGSSTAYRRVSVVTNGGTLTVQCQVYGQTITGRLRRTAVWNRLSSGRYVSDAYVEWSPYKPLTVGWCGQAPPTGTETNAQFITRVAPAAISSMQKYKVPASVTIAQAINESGWGRSTLTRVDHNYFGIKCFGTPGVYAIACHTYATSECEGTRCYRTTATFRVYRNTADSFADHGRFLVVNTRYRNAFKYTKNADQFAREIHKAGYATSPTYSTNLINLMKQLNLYKYDK